MSAPLALAGQQDLCPDGWSCKKNENGNSWILTAPEGENAGKGQVVLSSKEAVANREDTLDANLRRIVPEGTSVVAPPLPKKTKFGNAAMGIYEKESNSQRFMAGTFVGSFKAGGTITCSIYMPLLPDGMPSPAYIEFFDECETFATSGASFSKNPTLSGDTNKAIAKASVSEKTAEVEAYVLDLEYYTYGIGGMVLPESYPVVLLKNGVALRDLQADPANIDLTRLRATQAGDVGTWKRSQTKYYLFWPDDEEPSEIDIDAARPQVFQTGQSLDGEWTSVSGGGDSSLGGSETISAVDSFRFYKDGSFSEGRSVGAISIGAVGGKGSGASGMYRINGPSLTLNYHDGRVTTTSLFYLDSDDDGDDGRLLWIGGESYVE
jgi:hypothetical protein